MGLKIRAVINVCPNFYDHLSAPATVGIVSAFRASQTKRGPKRQKPCPPSLSTETSLMASLKRKSLETQSSDSPQPSKIAREDEEEAAPQIQSDEPITCLHEVSYPPGYAQLRTDRREKGKEKEKEKPAKEFPFQLDPFQAEAIGCLEIGESVMVAPHLGFSPYFKFS